MAQRLFFPEHAHGHLGVDPGGAFGLRMDLVSFG